MKKNNIYFVSGIDTNIGKSYATGFLAKLWNTKGIRTITQKFIQTGNTGMSEDIELHRKIMGTGLLEEDLNGLTMPEIFTYPCSPHLAAEIDKREIDFDKIEKAYKYSEREIRRSPGGRCRRTVGATHTRVIDYRLYRKGRLYAGVCSLRQIG